MGHEPIRGGAVPVVLTWLEEHPVAGTDDLDRSAATLASADALEHVDRLTYRVRVPCGPGAGREVPAGGTAGSDW